MAALRQTTVMPLAGNELEAMFDATMPRIHGYFHHRCEPGMAEELTQETFLAAVAAVRQGVVVREPMGWLCQVARHKLIDHYRWQRRRPDSLAWDAWETTAGDTPGLGVEPWATPGWEGRTERALAALPVAQRQALVLRYMDGLSPPEIAVALDRSLHAVESLLARGRRGFTRAYAKEGAE